MSSSGLIYVAIVGAWAAYLVPRCLRRSDDQPIGRLGDRASASTRLLDRRERRDEAHYWLLRLRPAVRPTPVVKRRKARRMTAPASAPSEASAYRPAYGPSYGAAARPAQSPRARAGSVSAATMARRRRVLGLLGLASAAGVPAGAVGWLPVWAAGLPVLLLLTYVTELRAQLRRRRAIGLRQRRGQSVARVRRRRLDFAARLDSVRRALRPPAPPAPLVVDPPVEVHDGWRPIAVPLPTYVTAPKAPIRVRSIDISGDGAWTSAGPDVGGNPVDEDTAEIPVVTAPAQAAPEPIEEPVEQRAVND